MGAAKQVDREIPPQIKQQMNRFRRECPYPVVGPIVARDDYRLLYPAGASPMPTFDSEVQQVESIRAGKTQLTDPVLVNFHNPKMLARRKWKEVAQFYWGVATAYAEKNNRHIDELEAQSKTHKRWSIDQLERSTGEYERLLKQINQRDAMIDQLKDTIHLLTKRGI